MDCEFRFVECDELREESDVVNDPGKENFEEAHESTTSSSESESAPPPSKKRKTQHASLTEKVKSVTLARLHPTWSLQTLQKRGCFHLKRKDHISRWEKEIYKGGTNFDKYCHIEKWTYDRFVEARDARAFVSTRTLQEWAMSAAMQHIGPTFQFTASHSWVVRFKQRHRIRQRQVTKYVSGRIIRSLEEIQFSASVFQHQVRSVAAKLSPDFVINTDQTGCEYRVGIRRCLSYHFIFYKYCRYLQNSGRIVLVANGHNVVYICT